MGLRGEHRHLGAFGREGLWAPQCSGLVIVNNIFDRNGRKPNGKLPRHRWNANITVNEDPFDPTKSPTEDYLIANNIVYTTEDQLAAIRVDAGGRTQAIVLRDNLLRGPNRLVLIEGTAREQVTVRGMDEASGR